MITWTLTLIKVHSLNCVTHFKVLLTIHLGKETSLPRTWPGDGK